MPANSGTNFDFARAEAVTKYVYGSKLEELTPESTKVADEFDFAPAAQQLGRKFYQPVEPARSTGFTFNADGSAFTLNRSRAPQELTAEILGSEMVVRETMSYAMMQRALSGDTKTAAGLKAFVQATSSTFKRLSRGGKYVREAQLLYGAGGAPSTASAGLGVVSATTGSAGANLVVTMEPKHWATALWAGSEGGAFDIYSAAGAKRNMLGTDEGSVYVLSAVDSLNYKLTFTTFAGNNVTTVVPTDVIFFEGARTKECLGFVDACSQTTLWGINTASWNLWKPQTIDVGGMATFEVIMEGTARVADIGFQGTLNIHVSPATWKDICDDQAALARWVNKSGGGVTAGFEEISYVGQTGKVKIIPNIYVKRGLMFGFPEGYCKRIGSTDLTFTMPGYGKMLRELENVAGVEARVYSDQAPFVERPAWSLLYTGVVNSGD
jgi:hypothetical protein